MIMSYHLPMMNSTVLFIPDNKKTIPLQIPRVKLRVKFKIFWFPPMLHWWPSVHSECGRLVVRTPVRSSQRLKNRHPLLPWLAFTIQGVEQD